MVTHEARAAAIADRVLYLADGQIVRELSGASAAPRSTRRWRRSARNDARSRSRRFSTRKLRTALTAVAIVLGVATVSGTFVLTDSIDKAFDAIFSDVYRNTDATITPKSAFDVSGDSGTTEAAVRRVAAGEGEGVARRQGRDRRRRERERAAREGRQGDRLRRSARTSASRSIRRSRSSTVSRSSREHGRGRTRSSSTSRRPTRRTSRWGDDRRPGRGARRAAHDLRASSSSASVSSIGGATLAGFDLATAQRLFDKEGKLDQIRVAAKPGVSPATAHRADPRDPAAGHGGAHRRRPGRRGREGHRRVHLLPPLLPARVRRDRAVRRRVRDRQLALDHDRAADARARDAAHARRVAAPGAVSPSCSRRS